MTRLIKPQKHRLELANIFRKHIEDYQNTYTLYPAQNKIVSHILNCRTDKLGGHIDQCDHCGAKRVLYHSCRNRHCPKCQQIPREKWLEKRKNEVLPVNYFHCIFTLPHELNPLILKNKSFMLNTLFKSVSQTLLSFGQNELGGKLGFLSVLHTWDQKLKAHFHLHCLVAGGALSSKTKRWIPCKKDYLFNQEALSIVFRGKFIDILTRAIENNKIDVNGQYNHFKKNLYKHKWVVSVREPIKNPQHVIEYLARYTHRIAIANSRLLSLKNGNVTFRFKDRKNNKMGTATITAVEFIRRFFLHTLPHGFCRIRHYGFLANRDRKTHLNFIQRLLKWRAPLRNITHSLQEMMLKLTGINISLCPCCKKGSMRRIAELPRNIGRNPYNYIRPPNYQPSW
jgi:hypothetical protein